MSESEQLRVSDVVDIPTVAARLTELGYALQRRTIVIYLSRSRKKAELGTLTDADFPLNRWTVSNQPAWDWDLDILPWARQKGHLE